MTSVPLLIGDTIHFYAGTPVEKPGDQMATLGRAATLTFAGGSMAKTGPFANMPVITTGRSGKWTRYPLAYATMKKQLDRHQVTRSWKHEGRVAWAVPLLVAPPEAPELPVCVDCARLPSAVLAACWRHEELRQRYNYAERWEPTCSFGFGHPYPREMQAWTIHSQQGLHGHAYMRQVCADHLDDAIEWALGHSTVIPGSTALG